MFKFTASKRTAILASAALMITLGASACANNDKDMMIEPEPSLYDRLGGYDAISAVVDEFTARVAADDRLNQTFANTDIAKFKQHLTLQLCQVAGGPCVYLGRDMKTSHKGMHITPDQFQWTGEHLAAALDKFHVPEKEANQVLAAAGSMQDDIVGQ